MADCSVLAVAILILLLHSIETLEALQVIRIVGDLQQQEQQWNIESTVARRSGQIELGRYHQTRSDNGAPEDRPILGSQDRSQQQRRPRDVFVAFRRATPLAGSRIPRHASHGPRIRLELLVVGLEGLRVEFPEGDRDHDPGHEGQDVLEIELGPAEHGQGYRRPQGFGQSRKTRQPKGQPRSIGPCGDARDADGDAFGNVVNKNSNRNGDAQFGRFLSGCGHTQSLRKIVDQQRGKEHESDPPGSFSPLLGERRHRGVIVFRVSVSIAMDHGD